MKVKCYSKICCITTENSYKREAGKGENSTLIFQMLIAYFTQKNTEKQVIEKYHIINALYFYSIFSDIP